LALAYAAPTAILSHLIFFLGDVKRRELLEAPESAMPMRASAQRRSRDM